jgi:predicted anti-sigma-YlaC factor YlaD
MTLRHLSDEQLTDHLSGVSLPAIDDHLAACEACRQEAASMRASFQVFHHASMEWSEARQHATPRLPRAVPAWRPAVVLAVACVAVVAVILLFGVLRRPVKTSPFTGGNVAVPAASDSNTAELSQDNQLLAAIDKELDSADLSPRKMYGISESAKAR